MNLYKQLSMLSHDNIKDKELELSHDYKKETVDIMEEAVYLNNKDSFYCLKDDKERALAFLVLLDKTDTINLASFYVRVATDEKTDYALMSLINIAQRSNDLNEIIFFIERYYRIAFPKVYDRFNDLLPYMSIVSTDVEWMYKIHKMIFYRKSDPSVYCRKVKIRDRASEILANKYITSNQVDIITSYAELDHAENGKSYAITNGCNTREIFMTEFKKEFLKKEEVFSQNRQDFLNIVNTASVLSNKSIHYLINHPDVSDIIINKEACRNKIILHNSNVEGVSTQRQYRAKILLYGFHIPKDLLSSISIDSLDILYDIATTYPDHLDRILMLNGKILNPTFFRIYINLIKKNEELLNEFVEYVDSHKPTPTEMKRWLLIATALVDVDNRPDIKSIKDLKEKKIKAFHKALSNNYGIWISRLYLHYSDKKEFYKIINDMILEIPNFHNKLGTEIAFVMNSFDFSLDYMDIEKCTKIQNEAEDFFVDVYRSKDLEWIKKYKCDWMIDISKKRIDVCKEKHNTGNKFYCKEFGFKQKIAPFVSQLDSRIAKVYFKDIKIVVPAEGAYSEASVIKMYHNLAQKIKSMPPEEKITVLELFQICPVYDPVMCYKYIDKTSRSDSFYLQKVQHRFEGKLFKSKDEDLLKSVIGIGGKMSNPDINQKAIDYMDRHGYKHMQLLFRDIVKGYLKGELSLDD